MTTYSNSKPGKTTKSKYDQHHTGEVVNTLADAKQISSDYAANKRYVHRAKVSLVGDVNVKPYHPIYLDGLPNGLSGYWTVLSVRHTFGGIPARYLMELEVGTDIIGDVNPDAAKAVATRDVQAEISGQDIGGVTEPVLFNIQLSPNSSDLNPTYGSTEATTITNTSAVAVPKNITGDIFDVAPPSFANVSMTTTWKASSPKAVTNV